jgi:hypothetical protein
MPFNPDACIICSTSFWPEGGVCRNEDMDLPPMMRLILKMLKAFLKEKRQEAIQDLVELNKQGIDPEGFFYRARLFARLGETAQALGSLEQAVRRGFYCAPAFAHDCALETLRANTAFCELLDHADTIERGPGRVHCSWWRKAAGVACRPGTTLKTGTCLRMRVYARTVSTAEDALSFCGPWPPSARRIRPCGLL